MSAENESKVDAESQKGVGLRIILTIGMVIAASTAICYAIKFLIG